MRITAEIMLIRRVRFRLAKSRTAVGACGRYCSHEVCAFWRATSQFARITVGTPEHFAALGTFRIIARATSHAYANTLAYSAAVMPVRTWGCREGVATCRAGSRDEHGANRRSVSALIHKRILTDTRTVPNVLAVACVVELLTAVMAGCGEIAAFPVAVVATGLHRSLPCSVALS